MPRTSWIDDHDNPHLDEHVQQLEHFTQSIADGVVDAAELEQQEGNLKAAMRAVEADLDDATHAKVTKLLAELTAYAVMQVLHDLTQAKLQAAVR